jgi:hypothetical protein
MRMRYSARMAASVAAWLVLTGSVAAAQTPPSAEDIYRKAIATMQALPRPDTIAYTLDVSGKTLRPTCRADADDGEFSTDLGRGHGSYTVLFSTADGSARVEDIATHQTCTGPGLVAPFPEALENRKHSGAVASDFVLQEAIRDEHEHYHIALLDTLHVDGHDAYRLGFTPITTVATDETADSLREMVVDATTFLVRSVKIAVGGGVPVVGGGRFTMDVVLGPVGAFWVVTDFRFYGRAYVLMFFKNFDIDAHAHDFHFTERHQAM